METENIVFVGRLVELPSEAPRCGDSKVAVAYKFELRTLVKGRLKRKFVVGLIPCPDFKEKGFFVVNSDYLIEVSTDLQEARFYEIYNDYLKSKLFWVVSITKRA